MERWKKIVGFENYSVSTEGRVRNDKSGRVLKPQMRKGYLRVCVYNGSKKYLTLSRLVAESFIPNPQNHQFVNHKSEDKMDNRVNNLEWCDRLYNNTYGTRCERVKSSLQKQQYNQRGCIVDGVQYHSIRSAERCCSVTKGTFVCALNRGQTHCKGHTICYC